MEKIKQQIKEKNGIDYWYDVSLEAVVMLMEEKQTQGKLNDCFEIFSDLEIDEKVKFLEAICSVEDISLIPKLFKILNQDGSTIELAEPILDGLRCWELPAEETIILKEQAIAYYGQSKLLDHILDSTLLK